MKTNLMNQSWKMSLSKIFVLVICVIGMVSCTMPWAAQLFFGKEVSITGIYYPDGVVCFIYFALIAGLCFFTDGRKAWTDKMALGIALTTTLPGLLALYRIKEFETQASRMRSYNVDLSNYVIYDPAPGLYYTLIAIAGICSFMLISVLWNQREHFATTRQFKTMPATNFAMATANQ